MIKLTKVNGTEMMVNERFIAIAESTPDTVITMQNGNKYVVAETPDEIYARIMQYKKEVKTVERQVNIES